MCFFTFIWKVQWNGRVPLPLRSSPLGFSKRGTKEFPPLSPPTTALSLTVLFLVASRSPAQL